MEGDLASRLRGLVEAAKAADIAQVTHCFDNDDRRYFNCRGVVGPPGDNCGCGCSGCRPKLAAAAAREAIAHAVILDPRILALVEAGQAYADSLGEVRAMNEPTDAMVDAHSSVTGALLAAADALHGKGGSDGA